MKASKISHAPWGLIPQIFYDFLVRVVPGAALLMLFLLIYFAPSTGFAEIITFLSKENDSDFLVVVLFLFLSYLAGVLADHFWRLSAGRFIRKMEDRMELQAKEEVLRIVREQPLATFLNVDDETLVQRLSYRSFVMHDYLRLSQPVEAQRLLKLRAERRMSLILGLSLAVAALINGYVAVGSDVGLHSERWYLEIFLVIATVSCLYGAYFTSKQFYIGVCIMWLAVMRFTDELNGP